MYQTHAALASAHVFQERLLVAKTDPADGCIRFGGHGRKGEMTLQKKTKTLSMAVFCAEACQRVLIENQTPRVCVLVCFPFLAAVLQIEQTRPVI
jgi:hypothetical protein